MNNHHRLAKLYQVKGMLFPFRVNGEEVWEPMYWRGILDRFGIKMETDEFFDWYEELENGT